MEFENIKKNNNSEIEIKIETSNPENKSTSNLKNSNLINIEQDEKIESNQIKLVGLYDPAENDLNLNMWEFSDGEKILQIVEKLQKIQLSEDAQNIYKKLLLTNAFPPENNINFEEFIDLKINWLLKNDDLNLIKEFIIKNSQENFNNILVKYYLDTNLSLAKIDNACEIFSEINTIPDINYIVKYKIYCLIHQDKKEIAQLQYDLAKETGFKDNFFDKCFNFLMGYTEMQT